MKLTNKERDVRLIKYILIPTAFLFSIAAALGGDAGFLFAILVIAFLVGGLKVLFYNQRYAAAEWRYRNGELKAFPLIRLALVLFIVAISVALGYGVIQVIHVAL